MRKFIVSIALLLFTAFSVSAAFTSTFQVADGDIYEGVITKKIWLEGYGIPEVQLIDIRYKSGVSVPEGIIPSDPQRFDVRIGKELKRPFALIRVPAYYMDPATREVKQVTEFTAIIQENKPRDNSSPLLAGTAKTTVAGSVLANGEWYKIAVTETGFHKIDYALLADMITVPSSISTVNIRVYGNGGNMLSENNADPRRDDLTENAIWVNDGGDGVFNEGDYIIFYAVGPTAWKKDSMNQRFNHAVNIYEDKAYYFVNFDQGPGLRVQVQGGIDNSNVTVSTFDHYAVYEKDLVSPVTLGKEWWGEEFSSDPGKTLSHIYNLDLGDLTSEPARFKIEVGARSDANNNVFTANINGSANSTSCPALSGMTMQTRAIEFNQQVSGAIDVVMTFQPGMSSAKGFLNYIQVNARRNLNLSGLQQLSFRDWRSVGAGNIATYHLQGAGSATQVWDVTDPLMPVRMNGSLNGNLYAFTQYAEALHEFAALNGTELPIPQFVEKVANQNLHSLGQVDYIIAVHPKFLNQANELADFHRQRSGMRVIVATTPQIYNEFSSGSQDISAIRDFAKMFYDRAGMDTSEMPKYLLLFGDASYDYKNRVANNGNYVPTFESKGYSYALDSYCNDDFFSFLDDNENIENLDTINTMDLGVGRFPVTNEADAQAMVRKVKNYKSPASLGPWRLSTTLIADNADNAGDHMRDAETMGHTITAGSNIFNHTKVYLDAVPWVSTPGGTRAPDGNKMINDQIFKGTLLMNYSGHGNIQVLATERIITQDDYSQWKNFNKLPIIITATCDYGQFDHPEYVSSGEALMLKNDGGAIATLTTTQLVFADPNRKINQQYLEDQFSFVLNKTSTLGGAFRVAKNKTYAVSTSPGELINFRKFVLLGDPALTPNFPEYNIALDSITDGITSERTDSIKALGSYKVTGHVTDRNSNILNDFNGRVYVTIFDKPRLVPTHTNVGKKFEVQNNVIYKGRVTTENGRFSFSFIAPKDINYDLGQGKISTYAENGNTDAAGADTAFVIGGFSDNPVIEDNAPIVKPYIEDSLFKDGGITGSNTTLFVILEDETGINVSGNTVGHDLTAILDEDAANPYILNDYYETEANTYKRGYVYFPVTNLSDGRHSLRVKAWDVNNNSGEGVVNFEVFNGQVVKVQNLINYPNPFSDVTHFRFEHNHPGELLKVQVNIYSTAGVLVRTVKEDITPSGSRSTEITWDGTDNNGAKIPSGIYVYRMSITTERGVSETAYQKLVLIR